LFVCLFVYVSYAVPAAPEAAMRLASFMTASFGPIYMNRLYIKRMTK